MDLDLRKILGPHALAELPAYGFAISSSPSLLRMSRGKLYAAGFRSKSAAFRAAQKLADATHERVDVVQLQGLDDRFNIAEMMPGSRTAAVLRRRRRRN